MLVDGAHECFIMLVKHILTTATMMRQQNAPDNTVQAVLHPLAQMGVVQWVQGYESYVFQLEVTEQSVFSKDTYNRQLFMAPRSA